MEILKILKSKIHHSKERSSLNVFLTAQFYTGIFDTTLKQQELHNQALKERETKREELLKNHPTNVCLTKHLKEIAEEEEKENEEMDAFMSTAGNQ
jgi:hypothetical protein